MRGYLVLWMRIGRGTKQGARRSLASCGHMGVVRSAGQRRSRTVSRCPPLKRSMLLSLVLCKKAFGCGILWVKLGWHVLRLLSSPRTTTGLFLWRPTIPRMGNQNTSTFIIILFGHTSRMGGSTSSTLQGSSTLPIFLRSRLLMSNFKSTSRGLGWALAEGVCWDTSHDIHQAPLWTLTSLLSSRIFWYRRSASFIIVAPAFLFTNGHIGVEVFFFPYIASPSHFVPQLFSFMLRYFPLCFVFVPRLMHHP